MPEKWQQALGHWDAWNKSIGEAGAKIENEHGNVSKLMEHAKLEVREESQGSSQKLIFVMNDEMRMVWDIYDELERAAIDFISREIGLHPDSELHSLFADYWMRSTFPEFRHEVDVDIEPEIEVGNRLRYITLESKPKKDGKVINSISWYSGHVEPQEVARVLQEINWPFEESKVIRTGKGGRPSEEDRTQLEAILCYALWHKHKLTEAKIAKMFGWKTCRNDYNKPVSRTVRKRLTEGKELMKKHGYCIMPP